MAKKYILPEKRMRKYPRNINKTPWVKFKIVVPTQADKEQVQAALEYLHDCEIDTGYVPVNQLVHEYDHGDGGPSNIVVDPKLYERIEKEQNGT